jgi:hypothetical protein
MIRIPAYYTIWLLLLLMPASLPGQDQKPTFTDVSKKAGIDFRYTFGDYTYENILESSGSGITVFDFNGDQLMDLYMMNGTWIEGISDRKGEVFRGTPNKLYKNNGDGSFTEVSAFAGVDDRHWSMAAGAVDYDNDGDQDLYLLNYGPNVFYLNNGDGTFSDITGELGLQGPEKLNGFTKWSVGVAFWDHNLDGRLDAMVGNFLAFDPTYISPTAPNMMPHPSAYRGQATMLYEQQDNGIFLDVTKQYDLYYPESKCMGLTVFDFDEDGDMDIFQGNDHQMNFLFRNDNGSYKNVAIESGVAANDQGLPTGSMHGSVGDIDGDGLIDLLVTDLRHGALYRNLGNGLFEDISGISGISGYFAGKGQWGAQLFDYDNDGDLDIFTANGTAEELILQYPLLLENDGKGKFRNIGKETSSYFSEKRSARAAATWDYDNDGDLDLIVSHIDLRAEATLLRNEGGNGNHWLGLSLVGKNGPVEAIGAKIIVHAGGNKRVYLNQRANGYLTYSDPRVHVGLGKTEKVDKVEILWADGEQETFDIPGIDRYITITQNSKKK